MGNNDDALRERYRDVLTSYRHTDCDTLRRLVLLEGLPYDANDLHTQIFGRCSLRGLIWKALLGIGTVDVDEYSSFVRRGPSSIDSRVREDARRTFSKNDDFTARVPTDKMIRLLNAYVWSCGNIRGVYAQSMSLLAAPFLYVMPEPDAFHCFRVFLQQKVPSYVKRYSGARNGCQLLDKCLIATHPALHTLFANHGLNSEVYAFPSVSSLGACVQPISDTVRLWDIQLAFGVHMHILFTLSRLLLSSSNILETAKRTAAAPLITRQLEQGLGLDAETVLARAVPLAGELDPHLYDLLVSHAAAVPSSSQTESAGIPSLKGSLDESVLDKLDIVESFEDESSTLPRREEAIPENHAFADVAYHTPNR